MRRERGEKWRSEESPGGISEAGQHNDCVSVQQCAGGNAQKL